MAGSSPRQTVRSGVIVELRQGFRCVVQLGPDATVVAQMSKNFNRSLHKAEVGETVRVVETQPGRFFVLH